MKKSTIWFIAVTMGLLFLGLLYLQVKYFEESLHIRKEQFDESVARSLYQACHDLELSEAKVMLERELNLNRPDTSTVVRNAKPHESIPANVSKGLFLDNLPQKRTDGRKIGPYVRRTHRRHGRRDAQILVSFGLHEIS